MTTLNNRMKKQIEALEKEQRRVKAFANENFFDCTTAPFLIIKEYRDKLKAQIRLLRDNLLPDDDTSV